jgi:hypothetical protein
MVIAGAGPMLLAGVLFALTRNFDSLPAKCCRPILTAENAEVAEIYEILSGPSGLRGKTKAATPKRETIGILRFF